MPDEIIDGGTQYFVTASAIQAHQITVTMASDQGYAAVIGGGIRPGQAIIANNIYHINLPGFVTMRPRQVDFNLS